MDVATYHIISQPAPAASAKAEVGRIWKYGERASTADISLGVVAVGSLSYFPRFFLSFMMDDFLGGWAGWAGLRDGFVGRVYWKC